MERNQLHSLYDDLIENKRITHIAVSIDTKIPVESLRQFKKNASLGHDKLVLLEDWLRERGFTSRETSSDVLAEVRAKLMGCIDVLDNTVHPRGRQARVLLNQLKVIVGEYGSELEKIGLQNE